MKDNILSQDEFLALFPSTRFRYIHDVNKRTVQGNNILNLSLNDEGYGIFFSVNGFPPTGSATQSQLISLNANYVDLDMDENLSQEELDKQIQEIIMKGLESGILPPTIINRTKKGAHLFWLYVKPLSATPENIERWKQVQKKLVLCLGGDSAAIDPSRVLRVPYALHLKDPLNPFEIVVKSYKPESKCTLEELGASLPEYSEKQITENKIPAMEILKEGVRVGEGMRHMAIAQVAGLLLKGAKTPNDIEKARLALYGWDRTVVKSPEPFLERKKELDNTLESILKRELSSNASSVVSAEPQKLHLWGMSEILEHDFGEEDWLIENLIPKQGMAALSGNPGDYKTWISIYIALSTCRATSVFGKFEATQGAVLIIDEEDHLRLIKKRLELLGAKPTDEIYYLSQNGIKVDIEAVRDSILEIVKEKSIKLLILDSLVRVHQQDENDAKGMAKVFSSLQKIIGAGASILFTHHHRKQTGFSSSNPGQSMRGSSDILAAVDCHITLEKKKEEPDKLIMKQTKLRQAELLPPFEINIIKGENGPAGFEYAGDYDEKKLKAEEASEGVVLVLGDGMKSRTELLEALGEEFGKTAIEDGIKIAEEKERIERVPKEELPKENKRKAYYRIPLTGFLPALPLPIDIENQESRAEESTLDNDWFESLPA